MQRANLTSIGQTLADMESAYISAQMAAAPNATVLMLSGNSTRQISDQSQTLRPALGIERIRTKSLILKPEEKGPNGEQVYETDAEDERIRYVGAWANVNDASGSAPISSNVSGDYLEITFYGTGLNVLTLISNDARDWRAAVDGGSEGANIFPGATGSAILSGRSYETNSVLSAASGLTLGTHTVKLTNHAAIAVRFYGFEILNTTSSSIQVPIGEILSAGKKYTNSALQTVTYNTLFDGSPTLNGKGGRVLVYMKDGVIGKVIQQTDSSQLNNTSADHTNEEMIRKINWRLFGVNRADDFSTLTTSASNRSFVLDSDTTDLMGSNVNTSAAITGDNLSMSATATGFFILTFTGTGLDLIRRESTNTSPPDNHTITIDNVSAGTMQATSSTNQRVERIVSGLPYGTHTVKISRDGTTGSAAVGFFDFIIYAPKKPTLPAGAVQIADYYLMADFVANATAGQNTIATGVMRKHNQRELEYVGTWTATLTATDIGGWELSSTTTGDNWQYTFFGTGFDFRFSNNATTATWQFTVDGVNNLTTLSGTPVTSSYGAGVSSFTNTTGTLVTTTTATIGNGIRLSGLTLGMHTVKFAKTAGTGTVFSQTVDQIIPIHKASSTSIAALDLVNQIKFQPGQVDFGKAKAWVYFDGTNSVILASYNVTSVLRQSAGLYQIFFTTPFKSGNYVAVGSGNEPISNFQSVQFKTIKPGSIIATLTFTTTGAASDEGCAAVFFGELEGESV